MSIAVFVTAFASLFDSEIGWTLAFPGEFISDMLTVWKFLFTTSDEFAPVIRWQSGNVIFYTVVFYGISWAYTGLREESEAAKAQNDAVRPASSPPKTTTS